jgi:hypothetical protein
MGLTGYYNADGYRIYDPENKEFIYEAGNSPHESHGRNHGG